MMSNPVCIPLPCDTVAALEEQLAPWTTASSLALPELEHLALGTVVDVVLRLIDGSAALSLRVFVEWRHPAASPPPGHPPRTGLAVIAVDESSHELWRRLVARSEVLARPDVVEGRGAVTERAPRVPQLEPRWRFAPVDEDSAAERRALSERRIARARQSLRGAPRGETHAPRGVPFPGAPPTDPPPRPDLTGAAFLFEYPGRGLEVSIGRLERFAWPLIGTLRPSRGDVRTAHHAKVPLERPPDDDGLETSPAPTLPMPAASLSSSHPAAPPSLAGEPDQDVTLTDAPTGGRAESSSSLAQAERRLRVALLLRVDNNDATLLVPQGHPLPTKIESRVVVMAGHSEVKASLFEGDGERLSRHLWTGSIAANPSTGDVSVQLELDDDGALCLRSPDDEKLQVQVRLTTPPHGESAEHSKTRPWWRRLLRG